LGGQSGVGLKANSRCPTEEDFLSLNALDVIELRFRQLLLVFISKTGQHFSGGLNVTVVNQEIQIAKFTKAKIAISLKCGNGAFERNRLDTAIGQRPDHVRKLIQQRSIFFSRAVQNNLKGIENVFVDQVWRNASKCVSHQTGESMIDCFLRKEWQIDGWDYLPDRRMVALFGRNPRTSQEQPQLGR